MTQALRERVRSEVKRYVELANDTWGIDMDVPNIVFKKRGTTAGTASYTKWEVDYNMELLSENVEEFIARTVPHEVAHLVDFLLHPANFTGPKRSVHGKTWKNVMRKFGVKDISRCHSYNTSNVSTRRNSVSYSYTCKTCGKEMKLGPKRHEKMARGQARYWMRGCGRHAGYVLNAPIPPLVWTLAPSDPVAVKPKFIKKATVNKVPAGRSKLDICRGLYQEFPTLTRAALITLFVNDAGCTKAGASTYYQKIKKEVA